VVVTAPHDRREPADVASLPRFVLEAVLGSYSQIFFTRSRAVGVLLLAATFVVPVQGLFGLGAVLLALSVARLFHFSSDSIRAGIFSYNALLVGLGMAALFQPSPAVIALAMVATLLAVVATATLNAALGATFNLPSLTLPFLLVFYLLLAFVGELRGVEAVPHAYVAAIQGEALPHVVASYLKSLGAIFFLPRVDAGAMILVALLFYSRIGFVLSLLGFAVAYPISLHLVAVPDAELHLMMGYNLILVAVALGGVWFVARPTALLFALGGTLVGAVLTLGGRSLTAKLGLPLLILPFNLTVIPLLYAMRLRTRDKAPKAVDFWMGTPEENLNYFQTRMARFGYLYYVRFSLPFLGKWVCTQANDGEHTHQGHWRHGLDFEVQAGDGRLFTGAGEKPEDYCCYRLPVLAAADGTVAKVVDGIADNSLGEVNRDENWGNAVVLYHGPGLYSVVAHLANGSTKVREGEVVKRGSVLGLCGNSGRSPIPHLHFQLQATAHLGAPTIAVSFHEIVTQESVGETLHANCLPTKGERVRNLERDPALARLFGFPIKERFKLEAVAGRSRVEGVVSEIDLYGNLILRSEGKGGHIYFENHRSTLTIYDYIGSANANLYLLQAALPRIPFDPAAGLAWSDHLVARHFYPLPIRVLRDFIAPFLGLGGMRMRYRMERSNGVCTVTGESELRDGQGVPLMKTVATARDGVGLETVGIKLRGKTRRARVVRVAQPGDLNTIAGGESDVETGMDRGSHGSFDARVGGLGR
jgi:urea transporter/murein DD-endopeptidase MepM/ murein hydrolase activator NlpD